VNFNDDNHRQSLHHRRSEPDKMVSFWYNFSQWYKILANRSRTSTSNRTSGCAFRQLSEDNWRWFGL